MAEYQLTETDVVIRTADGAHIANHPDNRDRVAYEDWLAAGGVPDPVPPKITAALDVTKAKTIAQILGV
jgi:hypothetical protein